MKTIIKTLAVALIFLVALNVKASDDALEIKVNEEQNLIIELQSIENGAILSLQDRKGEVLFKDRFFHENNYSKILDFESLPDGSYSLLLEREFSISTSVIRKEGGNLSIDDNAYNFVYKPLFRINGKKVVLYLANPEEANMEIEVLDREGEVVASFKSKDLVLKKTLDFSNVPAGDYRIKIKTRKNNFVKTLTLG